MSKVKMIEKPCVFDDSIECPVTAVTEMLDLRDLGKIYCPICPIRIKMLPRAARISK